MNSKIFYYVLIGGLVLAATVGLIAFYFAAFGNLNSLFPPFLRHSPNTSSAPPAASNDPTITLSVDARGRLILSWKNLPVGARDIQIFRAREGQPRHSLWKTISVKDGSGSIQLQANYSSGLSAYIYYFEVVGGDNHTLWTSPPGNIATNPGSSETSPSNPSGGSNNPPPNPGSGPSSPPPLPPSETTTSTPPTTITYYTPQGDISGSTTTIPEQFWVKETNKRIEIGWASLSSSSVQVKILRAVNEQGPWEVMFEQSHPVTGEYSFYLLDEAVSQNAFYKLQSFSSTGDILDAYGPVAFHPSL